MPSLYQTIVNSSTGIAPKSFRTLVLEYTSESLEQQQKFVPKVCKTQARKTLSSNSSKIRAQGMQNTSQKNSFTLPLESKKNSFGPQEHMPSLETHRQVLQNTLQNCREIWP